MLNEIANNLYHRLSSNDSEEAFIVPANNRLQPPALSSTSDLPAASLDRITTGDPDWMVPPPMPAYGVE